MKVAIVDDTQLNLTLLQHLVRKLPDCEPICFTDPVVALNWCLANDPDLLVVDFNMPELDGIELTKRFRTRYPNTPVLMVTANHDTQVRHDALEIGVTDFLNKPLDNTEFKARSKTMLSLRQYQKNLEEEVRKKTQQIVEQERETIICLSRAAEYRDPETGAHIERMALYAKHIAHQLGLSAEQQDLLLQAAPMHDIGKVGTRDSILLKPGKLTEEEFAIMKEHAEIGYKVLSTSSSHLLQVAAEIAHTHHEKFDGSGYPHALKGEEIPLFGRIVAVADVFDALTSDRTYKQAWSIERATQALHEGSVAHFDPACISAFFTDFDKVLAIKKMFVDDQN